MYKYKTWFQYSMTFRIMSSRF